MRLVRIDRATAVQGIALITALSCCAPLAAGTGKTRAEGGRRLLDFSVSVRFNANAGQVAAIKRTFTDGSAVLADATDGQFAFGKVDIVNNSGASRQAEVWIHEKEGPAQATFGKYGTAGEHINMYYPDDFSRPLAAVGNAHTMAHEFVHHVWGVLDEYFGPMGRPAECEPAPGSATASFCLMDDYFRRGGRSNNGDTITLNELCVASNHDPDKDTWQEFLNRESCWQTLARHPSRSATAPADLPTDAAPTVTAPSYRELETQRRFIPLIDRSGSTIILEDELGRPSRIELAQQAANILVDFTKNGDEIGVASFSREATVNFPLTKITGPAVQTAAKAAVNALVPFGCTAIGSGLIAARNMIIGGAAPSSVKTVILFTDGFSNIGPGELTVVPSLVENDIAVITIAIGQTVNTANLSTIASTTGGKFFHVQTAADLDGLKAALSADVTGGGVLARQPGFLAPGMTETRTLPVDAATGELTVVLTTSPNDDMILNLISPGGTVVDAALAASSPDVDFLSSAGTHIFRVRRPVLDTGPWTLRVQGVTVADGSFTLTSVSEAADVYLTASSDAPQYVFPRPVIIQATPIFGLPVVGASVTARVLHPNGADQTIDLFDDGDLAHGDPMGDDGTYSAIFRSFSEAGSYRVDAAAKSLSGSRTIGGEELFTSTGAPSTEAPVPLFRRETSFTVVVEGVPATLSPVNELVTLAPLVTAFDATPVPGGPEGAFSITATFTNTSSTPINGPVFHVTELSGGNLLLNADGGPGGAGASLSPDVGADGVLSPDESFTTEFVVGLQQPGPFTFFVDLLGVPAEELFATSVDSIEVEQSPPSQSDLSVTITGRPGRVTVSPGTPGTVIYTATVTNNGPGTAREVVVTDELLVSDVGVGADFFLSPCPFFGAGTGVICSLGDIDSGRSATIDLVVLAELSRELGEGVISSRATAIATGSDCDPNESNNTDVEDTIVDQILPPP